MGEIIEHDNTGTDAALSQPARLLEIAVNKGADMATLERLMDLQDRWEAKEAQKAFNAAIAAFAANPPKVTKDKTNLQYDSRYSSLENTVNTVSAALGPHGLSASWEISQAGTISVTCVLSHVLGHSKSVTLSGPPDTSGKKNDLQQIKSTLTYLKLATFEAVTGTASEVGSFNDDGNSACAPVEHITEQQEIKLRELLEAAGKDEDKLVRWLKIDKLSDLPASWYDKTVTKIQEAAK